MMGNIETHKSVTPFWYRRISEIIWLLTVCFFSLWALGTFTMTANFMAMNLTLPVLSLVGAGAATILSIIGYSRPTQRSSDRLIMLGYLLIVATSLYAVITADTINTPLVAFWLLLSIFAAIFGLSVFVSVALATNAYIAYLYFYVQVDPSQLIMCAIALEIPLIVSLLIWRKGVSRVIAATNEQTTTFNALAKELSQVANKSDIVINAIADGVIAVDGAAVVQLINPAAQRIIGWGRQDALRLDYRSVLQLFDAKNNDLDDSSDPIQKCLHTNETIETDTLQLATTSGKRLMISLHVSPIGQIGSGAIIVFRDITAAQTEERQQAEFISTASHEMRTPVAAIEGYIGLAMNPQTATIDDKAKLYLSKAHESAQHLGRLFQDLLDISKADDGRLANKPRVIDIVTFIRDVTLSFTQMAVNKGLILLYLPDTDAPSSQQRVTPAFYAEVDPDHLREVIGNLTENAIKYTKSGDVTVDIKGDDTHVEIAVTDTGIGIPNEDISHLFQKFYRIDNTDTREIGGTGLGLYLCRRLVETMGGRIWVTSTLGKGSTFHVELSRMSNIDAIRAIEATIDQPENIQLHTTPSFLAGIENRPALPTQPQVIPNFAAAAPVSPTPPNVPLQPVQSSPVQPELSPAPPITQLVPVAPTVPGTAPETLLTQAQIATNTFGQINNTVTKNPEIVSSYTELVVPVATKPSVKPNAMNNT